jgi:hypothetical protein
MPSFHLFRKLERVMNWINYRLFVMKRGVVPC